MMVIIKWSLGQIHIQRTVLTPRIAIHLQLTQFIHTIQNSRQLYFRGSVTYMG